MFRIYAVVEGQSEQRVVDEVIYPHLIPLFSNSLVMTAPLCGQRGHKGGVRSWSEVRGDLMKFMRQSKPGNPVYVTTMFDYYALPSSWPGQPEAASRRITDRAECIERALQDDLARDIERLGLPSDRFVPYVQMHELEALIFASPESLKAVFPERGSEVDRLVSSVRGLAPEEIDDGRNTSPSQRIIRHIPDYDRAKPANAVSAIKRIALNDIRSRCPHFNNWLSRLESLART